MGDTPQQVQAMLRQTRRERASQDTTAAYEGWRLKAINSAFAVLVAYPAAALTPATWSDPAKGSFGVAFAIIAGFAFWGTVWSIHWLRASQIASLKTTLTDLMEPHVRIECTQAKWVHWLEHSGTGAKTIGQKIDVHLTVTNTGDQPAELEMPLHVAFAEPWSERSAQQFRLWWSRIEPSGGPVQTVHVLPHSYAKVQAVANLREDGGPERVSALAALLGAPGTRTFLRVRDKLQLAKDWKDVSIARGSVDRL